MKLTITEIICNATCSSLENDNVFLMIQSDAGVPARFPLLGSFRMGAGDSMTLPAGGYVVEFDYGVLITAWDRDSFIFKGLDSPDFLFDINVCTTSAANAIYTTYNHNDASYNLTRAVSN